MLTDPPASETGHSLISSSLSSPLTLPLTTKTTPSPPKHNPPLPHLRMSLPPLPPNYATALTLIDAAHAQDPTLTNGPSPIPYELHYSQKMTRLLAKHTPDASPALQLACRAQHFQRYTPPHIPTPPKPNPPRWLTPRTTHPATRPGYLLWRAKLKSQAATQVSALLTSPSITPPLPQSEIERIAALIRKEGLSSTSGDVDPEVQALEDVACLVFLEDQLDAFEAREGMGKEKVIAILQKTWGKMGGRGREMVTGGEVEVSERGKGLVGRALGG